MQLTPKQSADYARLISFYPYRMYFLVQMPGEGEAEVWAIRDRRAVNKAIREGASVHQIERS